MVYARSDDNLALNRVLDIARAVNDEWHSVSTMCLVAEALAKSGELVKAHEFAQQAVDSTKHPKAQESNPSLLISNAADALYRASEFDLGRLLADTIVDRNARASALGQVATALAEAGDTENAEKLGADALSMVETLTPDRSKAAAFASFSSALEDQGRHDTAREIANAALQVAQAIASDTERADALVKAYEALKKVGANEAADKTAEMVLEIAEHPSDYSRTSERCALAKALASTGDTKEAQRVGEIALSGVTESLEGDERAKQLKQVAEVMISAGAVNRAVEIAEEALMCTRSEWFKTYPLQEASEISDLAILFAKIGKTETALQLVARCLAILEPFESNLVYKNLAIQASAEAISTLGRFDQAVETVKGMEMDPEGRGVALLRIAEILISSGCEAKAIELIEEAKNVAGTSWWAPNWSEISRLMSLAGRREDALTYLVKALRSAKFSRPRVLSALASGSALLSTMDQGGTLCHIYESVNEVDGWWRVAQ
jgi:tetratricopeptide (TPR) repeat protein